ncbi:hypothetical protein RMSM_04898 [Rhodopirellula maiorica SM1]|uniref:Uncharacterized protein n=1 Tax=Rhodopirellula maiorica SM1 TaxID=1265738 RepID=M5RGB3_9BACT|nr:hypothetical protein RMSM_04898 [Rhodopirellula maiorica SM1]
MSKLASFAEVLEFIIMLGFPYLSSFINYQSSRLIETIGYRWDRLIVFAMSVKMSPIERCYQVKNCGYRSCDLGS